MEELLKALQGLKESKIKLLIDARMEEFRKAGEGPIEEIFKELCFCVLTANFSAERGIKMQQEIGNGFLSLSESELAGRLRMLGHRYPEARARYIVEARRHLGSLKSVLGSFYSQGALRDWLAENVKGLGYKESSHFLRNIGFRDLAILDFHIIDLLVKCNLIDRPKTLTKKRYLETEGLLRKIGKKVDLSLAELDLYLWYMETGRILK